MKKYIKSPLNYIGGKHKLLNQLLPLFPKQIDTFVDLFAGGCNVGINTKANKVIFNDNLVYLIDMYQSLLNNSLESTISYIENQITFFNLSDNNEVGYKALRVHYNLYKNPLDLFILTAFSFNHQIRFNNQHEFNTPFGRERSSFNKTMRDNLIIFINKLKSIEIQFSKVDFSQFNFTTLTSENDFVYCDPPYLITTGTYNDGKRGFKGWGITEEIALLELLTELHHKNIQFALSNVLVHKGKQNNILQNWLNNNTFLHTHYILADYANCNYQTLIRDKTASVEVLITNYITPHQQTTKSLFDECVS